MSVFSTTGKMMKENLLPEVSLKNKDLLLYEGFSGPFPPEGWETDHWTQCNTSCCGQEPPCACLAQSGFNKAYITSKPVDASIYEKVFLSFFFDARFSFPHYTYIYIRIRGNETSPWKDITPWDNPVSEYIFPIFVEIPIILGPDGHGDALQVNLSSMGNYYLSYACLDEVIIYSPHENNPPDNPEIIGKRMFTEGENGNYTYKAYSIDPEGDDIFYIIDWLDGEVEKTGPYASGENVNITVTIPAERGTYELFTIKAKDIYGAESNWTILEIVVPRNKVIHNPIFLRFLERFPFLNLIFNIRRNKYV
jgi:hypothetical protein